MPNQTGPPECDRCDEKLRNVKPAGDRRRRFLDAYRECGAIAPAARRAGVHRATVHRWRADPEFVAAMQTAMDDYFRRVRAEAVGREAERRWWREVRERERYAMRCHYLALARAAKRRKRMRY